MGNAECVYGEITNFKTRARGKNAAIKFRLQLKFHRFAREAIAINRDVKLVGQHGEPVDMVGMFVRDENAGEPLGRAANGRKALAGGAGAETGVNEQADFVGFKIGAIAIGTTAKDR